MATLLAAADWLPDNSYVDPDRLEFALTLALGGSAVALTLRDRLNAVAVARWRNRALLLLFTTAFSIDMAEPVTRWIFLAFGMTISYETYLRTGWGWRMRSPR